MKNCKEGWKPTASGWAQGTKEVGGSDSQPQAVGHKDKRGGFAGLVGLGANRKRLGTRTNGMGFLRMFRG